MSGMSEALNLSYLFLRVEGHHFPREQAAISVVEEEEGCHGLQWRLGGRVLVDNGIFTIPGISFQLSINVYDYNCHVDLIRLLRLEGELTKVRGARQKMSEIFPLTEGKVCYATGFSAFGLAISFLASLAPECWEE